MAAVEGQGTEEGSSADAPAAVPEPLVWKVGRFRVLITQEGREELQGIEVRGQVSGVFGVFRGDGHGLAPRGPRFSLIHLPTARVMATLKNRRECMAMAAELATLRVPWTETDPYKVVEGAPDQYEVQEIYSRYMGWRKG